MTTDQTSTVHTGPADPLPERIKEALVAHICDLILGRDPQAAAHGRALVWELRREGLDLTEPVKTRLTGHLLGSENPDVPF